MVGFNPLHHLRRLHDLLGRRRHRVYALADRRVDLDHALRRLRCLQVVHCRRRRQPLADDAGLLPFVDGTSDLLSPLKRGRTLPLSIHSQAVAHAHLLDRRQRAQCAVVSQHAVNLLPGERGMRRLDGHHSGRHLHALEDDILVHRGVHRRFRALVRVLLVGHERVQGRHIAVVAENCVIQLLVDGRHGGGALLEISRWRGRPRRRRKRRLLRRRLPVGNHAAAQHVRELVTQLRRVLLELL